MNIVQLECCSEENYSKYLAKNKTQIELGIWR